MTEQNETKSGGFELRDYFRILWLRKWTAILVITLVVTSALFLSYQQTPIYEAETAVLPPEPVALEDTSGKTATVDVAAEAQIATTTVVGFYAHELYECRPVFGVTPVCGAEDERSEQSGSEAGGSSASSQANDPEDASSAGSDSASGEDASGEATELPDSGADLSSEQVDAGLRFLRGVQVQPSRQAGNMFVVRVRDRDPAVARDKATAVAIGYLAYKRAQAVAEARAVLGTLEGSLKAAENRLRAAEEAALAGEEAGRGGSGTLDIQAEIDAIKLDMQEVRQAIDRANDLGDTPNPAVLPKRPALPNHVRDGVFAFILGLILGIGAAFLRDYVDDSLKGTEDVERQSGAPLIGVVPHVPGARSSEASKNGKRSFLVTLDDSKAPASEAYRTLRTNLLFMSVTGPVRKLLITSPVAGEGKTTTASNLAVVLAQAGQRVLLVGSDMRRPSVHRNFGIPNRLGLSSVLAGQASLVEAVADPGIRGLRVMPGGPVPPNPTELLGSVAMKDFLEQAAQVTDWVILDAPPVLGLADAAVLATLSDAALFVVNETTNRRVLAHARDQLAKVRARVVGTVLNNFGPAFSYYYSDYYAYTSQYYLQEPEREAGNGKVSRREARRRAKEAKRAGEEAGFDVGDRDDRIPPEERISSI